METFLTQVLSKGNLITLYRIHIKIMEVHFATLDCFRHSPYNLKQNNTVES